MIDELVKQIASLQAENARPREKIKELETTRQGVNYQELLEELLRLFYVDGDGHLQWSFSECADHPVFTNLGSVVEQELIKNHDSRNNGCIMHTENHDREPEEGDIVAWRHPACSSGLWMVESYDPCWNKKEGEDWVILMRRDEVAKRIADSKPIEPGLSNGIPLSDEVKPEDLLCVIAWFMGMAGDFPEVPARRRAAYWFREPLYEQLQSIGVTWAHLERAAEVEKQRLESVNASPLG